MHFADIAPHVPPWDGFAWAPDSAWEVDLSPLAWGGIDHHGWSYGVDFWVYTHPPPPGSGSCRWNQLTRRRRWVRVALAKPQLEEEEVKEEEAPPLNVEEEVEKKEKKEVVKVKEEEVVEEKEKEKEELGDGGAVPLVQHTATTLDDSIILDYM